MWPLPCASGSSMCVLRARCRVDDASDAWSVFGLAGAEARRLTEDAPAWTARQQRRSVADRHCRRAPQVAACAAGAAAPGSQPPALPALDLQAWRLLEVMSGVPRITAANDGAVRAADDQFRDSLAACTFRRAAIRGRKWWREASIAARSSDACICLRPPVRAQPGQEVFHSDDAAQPAGMVVNAAEAAGAGRRVCWPRSSSPRSTAGSLHLGSADGPLLQRLRCPTRLPTWPTRERRFSRRALTCTTASRNVRWRRPRCKPCATSSSVCVEQHPGLATRVCGARVERGD